MKKDKQFSIRIAAQDLETIRQKAAQAHMSQSDNNLNQLTVLANMGKVQFANLDSAVQEFAKINTALRELQEGGVAKSQSSIQNRENHRRNFKPCIGGR